MKRFMARLAYIFIVLAGSASIAVAGEQRLNINDFSMGMPPADVDNILREKYGHKLDDFIISGAVIDYKGTILTDISADMVKSQSTAPVKKSGSYSPLGVFIFAKGQLAQIQLRAPQQVEEKALIERLDSIYPGKTITYYEKWDGKKRNPIRRFVGKNDKFSVVYLINENNLIYSTHNYEALFRDLSAEYNRLKEQEKQKKITGMDL